MAEELHSKLLKINDQIMQSAFISKKYVIVT